MEVLSLEGSALNSDENRKQYVMLNYEDVKSMSDALIAENIEAYRVLAND